MSRETASRPLDGSRMLQLRDGWVNPIGRLYQETQSPRRRLSRQKNRVPPGQSAHHIEEVRFCPRGELHLITGGAHRRCDDGLLRPRASSSSNTR